MDKNTHLLSCLVGPCPECQNGRLEAVSDGESTNFVCHSCGTCWHPELDWVERVNPATCTGCPSSEVCVAALRPFGKARAGLT